MRKLTCLLLSLFIVAVLFCACVNNNGQEADEPSATEQEALAAETAANEPEPAATEAVSEETEPAPTETEPSTTEEPEDPVRELIESLLPDWEPDKVSDRSYYYSGFGFSVLSAYIEECRSKGFESMHDYDDNNTGWILCRDDMWIEISDNTHNEELGNPCYCSLCFFPAAESEGGMTAEEVISVTGDMGMGMVPVAAIDLSPEGLYANTGLQLYRVVYDMRPDGDPLTGKQKNDVYFLVGGGEAVVYAYLCDPIEGLPSGLYKPTLETYFAHLAFADIDSDGEYEVVMQGLSYSSVAIIAPVVVCKAVDGKPEVIHKAYYELDHRQHGVIICRGDKLYLATYVERSANDDGDTTYTGYEEHELTFDMGKLRLVDPDSEITFNYLEDMD